jgi:hypothetical protein
MARFEDTPELFGGGAGTGTTGNIICEWCGTNYGNRENEQGEPTSLDNESISHTTFGGKQICECCFEAVENAVLQRMEDIIPWFTRILQARERQTEAMQRLIAQLRETLQ